MFICCLLEKVFDFNLWGKKKVSKGMHETADQEGMF